MDIDRLIRATVAFSLSGLLSGCTGGESGLASSVSPTVPSTYQGVMTAERASTLAAPNGSTCGQRHLYATLQATEMTVHFRPDCGATGNLRIAGVTNLQSPPQEMLLCESPQPVTHAGSPHCSPSLADGNCQQANSTIWYVTIFFAGGPSRQIDFATNKFPVKFSSNTLVGLSNLYGLCVIDNEDDVIQDDFADGHDVAPKGDTVNLKVVLPPSFGSSYPDYTDMDLFFETKPAGDER